MIIETVSISSLFHITYLMKSLRLEKSESQTSSKIIFISLCDSCLMFLSLILVKIDSFREVVPSVLMQERIDVSHETK